MPDFGPALLVVVNSDAWIASCSETKTSGFRPSLVGSMAEAQAHARREPVDLLLIESHPERIHEDLLAADRIRSADPGIQTVLLTETTSDELRELAPASRVAACLTLNDDSPALEQTLRSLFERRQKQFGRCVGCRFHLPLLRPDTGKGQNFRCTVCRQHYLAEFDEHAPAAHHDFVERID